VPIYIVSKGRVDTRLTSRTLEMMGVPYFIVVEQQERDQYAAVIDPQKVLVLDPQYQRDYDAFDDLGDTKSKGPGPARNFAWDHAVAHGAAWHWVMDDNIKYFWRLNRNVKAAVADGAILTAMEDFCGRYKNVAMAGPNYYMFAPQKIIVPPFVLNTRIYSCNLIKNDVPFRWRGRYNEDTDLSLRMLKAGWCTVQFNAFLQGKAPTQTIQGGNTEVFYHAEGKKLAGEKYARGGTLAKSKLLVKMHPDVSRLVWRFGRWHHHVDYSRFRNNPLVRRDDVPAKRGVDNYGMEVIPVEPRKQYFVGTGPRQRVPKPASPRKS
jgi:hypothetical protein